MENIRHISVFDACEDNWISSWILDKYPEIKLIKPLKEKTKQFKLLKFKTDEYVLLVYKPRKNKLTTD